MGLYAVEGGEGGLWGLSSGGGWVSWEARINERTMGWKRSAQRRESSKRFDTKRVQRRTN